MITTIIAAAFACLIIHRSGMPEKELRKLEIKPITYADWRAKQRAI